MGTPVEQQAVRDDFTAISNWGIVNGRPMNIGEFGAYSTADMDSRARWTAFVARTAEAKGMSWHYWEFIAGFGVYNAAANDWNYALLDALVPGAMHAFHHNANAVDLRLPIYERLISIKARKSSIASHHYQ
jgi:endoglucanase